MLRYCQTCAWDRALGSAPALRAGRALVAHHGLDRAAKVEIRKGIPVAGGMAGGSADAAATLVALDRLWDLQTPDDDLLRLAAGLGSDVPFALLGGTALGAAVRAGLATEHTPGAADALDAALRTPLLPHTVEEF